MDGNSQTGFLFDFDPESEMVSNHHRSRCCQVKDVLDDCHAESFFIFQFMNRTIAVQSYRTRCDMPVEISVERWRSQADQGSL